MSSKHLLVTYEGRIQKILFNRPEKKNAISYDIYKNLPHILQSGATNPNVTLTVLTGAGNFYSSGMDLSNDIEELADVECERLEERWESDEFANAMNEFFRKKRVNSKVIGYIGTNWTECERLEERWESDEFANAMNEFFRKKWVNSKVIGYIGTNWTECERLEERWESDEFANAMNEFFRKKRRKSKL
ncbi:hypothetical protein WDU94_003439 [Cyamophila willieti]